MNIRMREEIEVQVFEDEYAEPVLETFKKHEQFSDVEVLPAAKDAEFTMFELADGSIVTLNKESYDEF